MVHECWYCLPVGIRHWEMWNPIYLGSLNWKEVRDELKRLVVTFLDWCVLSEIIIIDYRAPPASILSTGCMGCCLMSTYYIYKMNSATASGGFSLSDWTIISKRDVFLHAHSLRRDICSGKGVFGLLWLGYVRLCPTDTVSFPWQTHVAHPCEVISYEYSTFVVSSYPV